MFQIFKFYVDNLDEDENDVSFEYESSYGQLSWLFYFYCNLLIILEKFFFLENYRYW